MFSICIIHKIPYLERSHRLPLKSQLSTGTGTCGWWGSSSSNTTQTLLILVSSAQEKRVDDKLISLLFSIMFFLLSFAVVVGSTFGLVDFDRQPKIGGVEQVFLNTEPQEGGG